MCRSAARGSSSSADRPVGEGAGESITVPVREEQVNVVKQPMVTEEVEVGKRKVRDAEQVSDTARREEARIEREGDVEVRGDPDVSVPREAERDDQAANAIVVTCREMTPSGGREIPCLTTASFAPGLIASQSRPVTVRFSPMLPISIGCPSFFRASMSSSSDDSATRASLLVHACAGVPPHDV